MKRNPKFKDDENWRLQRTFSEIRRHMILPVSLLTDEQFDYLIPNISELLEIREEMINRGIWRV